MFGSYKNPNEIRKELHEVTQQISEHPLAAEQLKQAQELVERRKAEQVDPAEINRELTEQGLPSLEEQGKATTAGARSYYKLHRKKRKLERKLEAAS
ncbi:MULTISPECIES: hypothetical protein [Auritidibacter]|uniref:Uncharacterized protein n=1 Tax=Auritidibacter ignavus TaxID=678932 RepID=A0AAJ6DEM3_9MICC|nr:MULTISPECIES: hypothetical protein [Auritidibacter]AXR74656.1 hypothetical protein DCC27_010450 [Auritidibacter sp. NML130574]NIH71044.1 hypothetical protein [Auritidibacter ignavus]RMX22992.1 hypothetical protein DYI20_07115 [Auritidibacter ignavus]WGH81194.1 hypothetical protein QDX25_10440 [Auritidibacter ignavus]WGH83124.1 hypothetical protein QDX20_07520 [Auritidibacter ignavus]